MAKPKKLYLPENATHSGIDVTYVKSANSLRIGGWYDSMVGISGGEIHLAKFFEKLGITEKDCRQALFLSESKKHNNPSKKYLVLSDSEGNHYYEMCGVKLGWKPHIEFGKYHSFRIAETSGEDVRFKTVSKQQAKQIANYD